MQGDEMAIIDNVRFELEGRLEPLQLAKKHLSIRYEPETRLVRVGACISEYSWETRERVLDVLLDFEDSHVDDFALEFDIVPLEAVTDVTYAEI